MTSKNKIDVEKLWKTTHINSMVRILRTRIFPTAIYEVTDVKHRPRLKTFQNEFENKRYVKISCVSWAIPTYNKPINT